jgi:dipeptidyl aminopeptidase/acylaminoacyl peptidase
MRPDPRRRVRWPWLKQGFAIDQRTGVSFRQQQTFLGKAFIAASEKEHARKMHDDLIDMVEWAVKEGIAQKDKIAIFGISYGGLASFIGATFTPDFFRCSVPVVGITNLQTLLESMPPYWAGFAEYMYRSYGDPRTEEGRELLAERSPINKVDNIRKPMLIFHGLNDVRCNVGESDTIVAAMQARDIPVTYVVCPDEGHGFFCRMGEHRVGATTNGCHSARSGDLRLHDEPFGISGFESASGTRCCVQGIAAGR